MTTQEILEAARAARSALGLSSGEVRRAALLGQHNASWVNIFTAACAYY